mmetsp:Transcript_20227/g.19169  ORF Transcript_20227/g.19169 Transcript_20227/m.19169 type:complete len:215 (+) Transcript_20227:162-806(+)
MFFQRVDFFFFLHVQEDFLATDGEDVLDIMASLGAGLEEHMEIVLLSKLQSPLIRDFPLIFLFVLIPNQIDSGILFAILSDVLQPLPQTHEGFIPCDVIDQEHALRFSVEDPSHGPERFLSRSVPDLELDDFFFSLKDEVTEFNPYCHLMFHLELLIHHTVHQTTLPNARISNYDQLDQVVLPVELRLVTDNFVGDLPQLFHFIVFHCNRKFEN